MWLTILIGACSVIDSVGQDTAVLVATSMFWHNYRHDGGVMDLYNGLLAKGVPPSDVILMVGGNAACNDRNPHQASVSAHGKNVTSLNSGLCPLS